jgi:tetratricopeptide (TPR) repeat protein
MFVAMTISAQHLSAQLLPERRLVRKGNEQFQRRNFYNSFNRYSEALEYAPGCYEAQYNRANAYLQLMLSNPQDSTLTAETSNNLYESIINNPRLSTEQRGEVMRNIGESLFLQQDYEAALNAFRESLKLNADDQETKRNYVLTKRIVDQKRHAEQQQQQNNQDQQQQQQDQQQSEGEDDKDKDEPDEGDDRQDSEDQEVEAVLKKAQERSDEHEAEKKARMRKAPLPPNERDW